MSLIPGLSKLPDVDAVVQKYDKKLDRLIELMELIAAAIMTDQGLSKEEISNLLKPKK